MCKVAGHISFISRKQSRINTGTPLTFLLLFSQGLLQKKKWCHPYSGSSFIPQLTASQIHPEVCLLNDSKSYQDKVNYYRWASQNYHLRHFNSSVQIHLVFSECSVKCFALSPCLFSLRDNVLNFLCRI